ncbi:MAG: hypothetical protein EPN91_03725 [Salinibacterium sp.]|nr:MAG: hypothetical protein EPN91_03725 [Salinibacterium sp.]
MTSALRKLWWVVLLFGVLGGIVASLTVSSGKGATASGGLPVIILGALVGGILGALIVLGRTWTPRRSPRTSAAATAKSAAPQAVAPKAPTLAAGQLVAGRTAWSARQIGFVSHSTKLLVAEGIAAFAILTLLLHWNPLIARILLPLSVLLALFAVIARTMERRATKRERAAGYTTLNGLELDVEQRHPRTGQVIRKANAKAIPREKFNEILAAD